MAISAPTRRPVEPDRSSRTARYPFIALGLISPVAFLLIQVPKLVREYRWLQAQPPSDLLSSVAPHAQVALDLSVTVLAYLALVIPGLVLGVLGKRAFPAPALAFVLLPLALDGWQAFPSTPSFATASFGQENWLGGPWVRAFIDLGLALGPAVPLFMAAHRTARRRLRQMEVVALASLGGLAALTATTNAVIHQEGAQLNLVAPLFLFGALAGTARPWWPLVHVVEPLLLAGIAGAVLYGFVADGLSVASAAVQGLPLAIIALLGSAWRPGALVLERVRNSSGVLLAGVNALNVADALLTHFQVGRTAAVELNPVVRLIGLPAKILVVGVASWWLYRIRPRLLVLPALVFLGVLAYHVAGIFVNAGR